MERRRGPSTATALQEDTFVASVDQCTLPLADLKTGEQTPATDAGDPSPDKSCSSLLLTTAGVESEVVETDDCEERVWQDGQLHWGERLGDGWTEYWHTQEGSKKRFGGKRGKDEKQHREWQERWEQTDSGTRIEKRVTQLNPESSEEVERWIERLDITSNRILESRVGEDRVASRQWRSYHQYDLDENKKRLLKESELEEVWGWDASTPKTQCKSRVTTSQLQPGDRVRKTKIVNRAEGGEISSVETSYEDVVTGRCWGYRESRDGDQEIVEEWTRSKLNSDFEEKLTRTSAGRKTGRTKSYCSATGEFYTEEWGRERVDATTQRSWNSKTHSDERNAPWGEYRECIERFVDGTAVSEEVVHNEKWWTENDERHSEHWTEEKCLNSESGKLLRLKKYGSNEYGPAARERWHEVYETLGGDLILKEKRLEKDNINFHTIIHEQGNEEHHQVEDKTICQIDKWHINNDNGEKWGEKEGTKDGVTWRERWSETQNEKWLEKWWCTDSEEWGELSGQRGDKTRWTERWGKSGKSHWRERTEIDEIGNTITTKDGERWDGDVLKDKYTDKYGETIDGELWAFKSGLNEDGEWLEKWNERKDKKTAEKRGSNKAGDQWFEAWNETYDTETGVRISQSATKKGSNALGDEWMEVWVESPNSKYACKKGARSDEKWLEEWKEEEDGSKWCKKWASRNDKSWGQAWGDSPKDNKHWGRQWQNDQVFNSWDY